MGKEIEREKREREGRERRERKKEERREREKRERERKERRESRDINSSREIYIQSINVGIKVEYKDSSIYRNVLISKR